MIRTAAVVAHFSPEGKLDPTFRLLLDSLVEICELVILVTTCRLPSSEIPSDTRIVTIQRPNIGYDFYSYRVGVSEIMQRGGAERLFVLNSSFLILNQRLFVDMLKGMIDGLLKASIMGCSESLQCRRHLQSYLLLFRGDVLRSDWFQRWLLSIEPRNSKLEVIISGEFGLAKSIIENGVIAKPFFKLNIAEKFRASTAWMSYISKNGGLAAHFRNLRHLLRFNPVHFAAQSLARRCGIAKTELLRDNPCGVTLDWVTDFVSASERKTIDQFLEKSRQYYRSANNGLTVLEGPATAIPALYLVTSGPLSRPGVRVAVVVHLFYPELIGEIREYLRNIIEPFDLFITTPHEGAVPAMFNAFGRLAQTIAIGLCENRGRDIGPFIAIHQQKFLDPYDAVLKIHGKQSTYSEEGEYWRQRLFKELCGDSGVVQKSIDLLRRENVGIVGPHHDYLTHEKYWGANREKVRELLKLCGITSSENPELGFFAGSMFWFKPVAISSILTLPEDQLAFEQEKGIQDGTLAHALERVFCTIARSAGYRATSVSLGGRDMNELDTLENTVPVLRNLI